MKNVVAFLLLIVGFNSFAQDEQQIQKQDQTMEQGAKKEMRFRKMASDLQLNEKQSMQVKELFDKQDQNREAKMAAFKAKKVEGTRMSKEERVALKTEMEQNQQKITDQMKAILNADQFVKWQQIQAERKEKIRSKMKEKMEQRKN